MITPTVGRVVWYHPERPHVQPWAAIVTYVHSDSMVNLVVFDENGIGRAKMSVHLAQENEATNFDNYCEWMPYQKAVAKGDIAPTLHATKESAS